MSVIGNDHGHKNAWKWKGSAGQQDERENDSKGILEQIGHGLNMARMLWRGLLVFVFQTRENAFKFHRSVNVPEVRMRI